MLKNKHREKIECAVPYTKNQWKSVNYDFGVKKFDIEC